MGRPLRIHFEVQYVGKLFKMAKRRVMWKFAFDGDNDEHSVVLMHTINSGKKVLFLNGHEIFQEEKMTAGQFVYPFQLDGHLLTIYIEPQVETEGMYDLRVDGVPYGEFPVTTLLELRANAKGGGRRDASETAWRNSGGGNSNNNDDNYSSNNGRNSRYRESEAEEPAVPSVSLKDFVGDSSTSTTTKTASSTTHSSTSGGGSWDPFGGEGGNADTNTNTTTNNNDDFFGSSSSNTTNSASAPPLPKKPVTTTTTSTTAVTSLKPPTGNTSSTTRPTAQQQASFDPFGDIGGSSSSTASSSVSNGGGPRRASGGVTNLVDDLAGLSFGGPSHATGTVNHTHNHAVDPFAATTGINMSHQGHNFGTIPAPAPAHTGSSTNALDDLFGSSGPSLVNLDNLNSAPKTNTNNNRPSLGQLASQSAPTYPTRNVMGGSMNPNGGGAGTSGVALGNLDFGLGMAGINVNNLGNNNNNNNNNNMMMNFHAPAPAPKASVEYNPFE